MADRTEKRPRKISALQVRGQQNKYKIDLHGNLSNLLKDYRQASFSGASAEPNKHDKDIGLSEPLHEFETRIKEREFVDVGI